MSDATIEGPKTRKRKTQRQPKPLESQVMTSPSCKEVESLKTMLFAQEMQSEKIMAIKNLLSAGKYEINDSAIAEKLIENL